MGPQTEAPRGAEEAWSAASARGMNRSSSPPFGASMEEAGGGYGRGGVPDRGCDRLRCPSPVSGWRGIRDTGGGGMAG